MVPLPNLAFPIKCYHLSLPWIIQFSQLIYFRALPSLSLQRLARHTEESSMLSWRIYLHPSAYGKTDGMALKQSITSLFISKSCGWVHLIAFLCNSTSLEMYFHMHLSQQTLRLILDSLVWSWKGWKALPSSQWTLSPFLSKATQYHTSPKEGNFLTKTCVTVRFL